LTEDETDKLAEVLIGLIYVLLCVLVPVLGRSEDVVFIGVLIGVLGAGMTILYYNNIVRWLCIPLVCNAVLIGFLTYTMYRQ